MMKKLLVTLLFLAYCIPAHADTTTGLVGWWKLDEGTGTNAGDSSGQGNNGTLSGSTLPSWVPGKIGPYALSFDGSSSYVSLGTKTIGYTNLTVAAWVKITGSTCVDGDYNGIVSKNGYNDFIICYQCGGSGEGTTGQFGGYEGPSGPSVFSNVLINDGNWHHVVLTSDGAYENSYVDGQFQNKEARSGNVPDTSAAITIGVYSYLWQYFPGFIDDVRIYNRALSEQDVLELYNQGLGGHQINNAVINNAVINQ